MSETPINLNKARKAKAKFARKASADENAIRHGQSKVEKDRIKTKEAQKITRLDAHRRDT